MPGLRRMPTVCRRAVRMLSTKTVRGPTRLRRSGGAGPPAPARKTWSNTCGLASGTMRHEREGPSATGAYR